MFRFPDDLTTLELPKLDLSKLPKFELPTLDDLPKFDLSKLPKFDLPEFDLPKFELPKFDAADLPKFEVPVDIERATAFARDAAYVGIGAVVIAVEKADERRRELDQQRREFTDELTSRVRKLVDRG